MQENPKATLNLCEAQVEGECINLDPEVSHANSPSSTSWFISHKNEAMLSTHPLSRVDQLFINT